jgi:hypothetical protein
MRALLPIVLLLSLATAASAQPAREAEPAWRTSALALVPAGYVAGEAYRTDASDKTGYLAVYPANANDPKTPGSVFAARQVLAVTLSPDAARAVSAELKPRSHPTRGNRDTTQTDPDGVEREHAAMQDALAAGRASLPPETEPCALRAWSADPDPKGLNVRGGPSAKSPVVGPLPPPYRLKTGGSENTPDGGWLTEFSIIGFKDGWFLIEGATPPGKQYEDEKKYPRNASKPYAGRGWVASNKVGANFANGATRYGGLFQAPHADAAWTPAKNRDGFPLDGEFGPKRIFACSGVWALVESFDGVRGWWRHLCNNQVTNCS